MTIIGFGPPRTVVIVKVIVVIVVAVVMVVVRIVVVVMVVAIRTIRMVARDEKMAISEGMNRWPWNDWSSLSIYATARPDGSIGHGVGSH